MTSFMPSEVDFKRQDSNIPKLEHVHNHLKQLVRLYVFNAAFNNISVTSWWSNCIP